MQFHERCGALASFVATGMLLATPGLDQFPNT